jgi:hypothetical protein
LLLKQNKNKQTNKQKEVEEKWDQKLGPFATCEASNQSCPQRLILTNIKSFGTNNHEIGQHIRKSCSERQR